MPRDPGHGNVPGLPSRISRSSGQPEWRGPRPADNQGRRQETARLPHWLAGRLVPPRPHLVGSRDAAPLPHPDHAQRLAGSLVSGDQRAAKVVLAEVVGEVVQCPAAAVRHRCPRSAARDRKSTRLNSSHVEISYAVFCLKKKKKKKNTLPFPTKNNKKQR